MLSLTQYFSTNPIKPDPAPVQLLMSDLVHREIRGHGARRRAQFIRKALRRDGLLAVFRVGRGRAFDYPLVVDGFGMKLLPAFFLIRGTAGAAFHARVIAIRRRRERLNASSLSRASGLRSVGREMSGTSPWPWPLKSVMQHASRQAHGALALDEREAAFWAELAALQ